VRFAGRSVQPSNLAALAKRKASHIAESLDFCIGGAGTHQAKTLKPGETLFLQGDNVRRIYVLRDGWAFRSQTLEDGRRQIVDFVLPGDVIGLNSSRQILYGVEALSPSTWIMIPRESFLTELRHQPVLSMKLVEMLSTDQVRAFGQITSVGRRTARERVAHLLLDLSRRARSLAPDCEGTGITMPLMLSHIGDALGLATETVCRCLGELKRAGILAFSAGRLEILDLGGLSDLVGALVDDDYPEQADSDQLSVA
jgi:CRP-like cAMP-binding protein